MSISVCPKSSWPVRWFGGTDECALGAAVALSGNGKIVTAKTNVFGDFEFEGLADSTDYTVRVEADGYEPKELTLKTTTDIYLCIIIMQRFDNN